VVPNGEHRWFVVVQEKTEQVKKESQGIAKGQVEIDRYNGCGCACASTRSHVVLGEEREAKHQTKGGDKSYACMVPFCVEKRRPYRVKERVSL
jgi:hypothetical protein